MWYFQEGLEIKEGRERKAGEGEGNKTGKGEKSRGGVRGITGERVESKGAEPDLSSIWIKYLGFILNTLSKRIFLETPTSERISVSDASAISK